MRTCLPHDELLLLQLAAFAYYVLPTHLSMLVLQELAWTSFALLKNVNCCSVLLLQPEAQSALMARGAVAQSVAVQGNAAASLAKISQVGLALVIALLRLEQHMRATDGLMQYRQGCMAVLAFAGQCAVLTPRFV
jgi:hypothetical protein